VASVVREVKAVPVDRVALADKVGRAVVPADPVVDPAALVDLKDAVVKVVLVDRADAVVERWKPSSTRS
jgi:hypothetical protein